MNAPYAITTVTINENLKKIIKPNERNYKFWSYFFCAGIAGATASFVTCPMDNIKTKLQVQSTVANCENINFKEKKFEKEFAKSQTRSNPKYEETIKCII
jgi:hypothetical protein